jgi:hypothetical protein
MDLQRDIYKAIKGTTRDKPQNLVGIIGTVDARQKLVVTYNELCAGLKSLIETGKITQLSPVEFYEIEDVRGSITKDQFICISQKQYQKAIAEYLKMAQECLDEMENQTAKDDFGFQKLAIRWKLPGEKYATHKDEDCAEKLTEKIEGILREDGRAEVNGFEYGPGHIDILIFGRESNQDTDNIYLSIIDAFRTYGCPKGSYIIRNYLNSEEEVISDKII